MSATTTPRVRGAALVTGASSGIGLAFAHQLAARGYDVVLTARRVDRLEQLAGELNRTYGVQAIPIESDLASPEAPAQLFDDVRARGIDVGFLVNNAGTLVEGMLLDHGWDEHAGYLQLMLRTPAELIHRFLPDMLARQSGAVLTVGSWAALWPCMPGLTFYAASKQFMVNLTRTLSQEYAGRGVTFTVTCPGLTRTELLEHSKSSEMVARLPKFLVKTPEAIVVDALRSVDRGRVERYPGFVNHASAAAVRVLPTAVTARGVRRFMALGHEQLSG